MALTEQIRELSVGRAYSTGERKQEIRVEFINRAYLGDNPFLKPKLSWKNNINIVLKK